MLLGKKLLLITGKGGIGKSLITASLGQAAAEAGRRTLLVESAALDQLAPLFGAPPAGHTEVPVADGLSVMNIDPAANFRDYFVKYLGQAKLFDKVLSHRVVQSFFKTIPGLAELMVLGRLYYECDLAPPPQYDLVIFDAPASGHFLSLMTTPDAVLASNLVGPMRRETERVRGFLADAEKVGIVYVSVPEGLVVSETLDFLPKLRDEAPARLLGTIVNRVPSWEPEAAADWGQGPAARYLARRAESARLALAALREGLAALTPASRPGDAPLPLWTLPDLGSIEEPLPRGFGWRLLGGPGGPLAEARP